MPSYCGCSARGLGMMKFPLIIQSHCLRTYSIRSLPIYHNGASLLCPLRQVHIGMCERHRPVALSSYIQVSSQKPWDACVNVGLVKF